MGVGVGVGVGVASGPQPRSKTKTRKTEIKMNNLFTLPSLTQLKTRDLQCTCTLEDGELLHTVGLLSKLAEPDLTGKAILC